jgi:heptosyltransferase-1
LRLRQLFAQALGYKLADDAPIAYDLDTQAWSKPDVLPQVFHQARYLVCLHGTTWETKYWPEEYWIELLEKTQQAGFKVVLPWGSDEERERALRLRAAVSGAEENQQAGSASASPAVWVPERMLSLNEMARTLKHAAGVVSVDTGLSHVAAALEVPMVVLYRVTDPKLVGADGPKVTRLASPCAPGYIKQFKDEAQAQRSLEGLSVEAVWSALFKGQR